MSSLVEVFAGNPHPQPFLKNPCLCGMDFQGLFPPKEQGEGPGQQSVDPYSMEQPEPRDSAK